MPDVTDVFERIVMLKRSPMFSEVATEDLRMVAQELEEEFYLAGDRVFEVNDQGDYMYLLLAGRIGISTDPDPSRREFIVVLEPGECFGEMGILDDQPRSGTAHVLEDAKLLSLEKARLRGLILDYPELALGMLRSLSLRVREANARARQQQAQMQQEP